MSGYIGVHQINAHVVQHVLSHGAGAAEEVKRYTAADQGACIIDVCVTLWSAIVVEVGRRAHGVGKGGSEELAIVVVNTAAVAFVVGGLPVHIIEATFETEDSLNLVDFLLKSTRGFNHTTARVGHGLWGQACGESGLVQVVVVLRDAVISIQDAVAIEVKLAVVRGIGSGVVRLRRQFLGRLTEVTADFGEELDVVGQVEVGFGEDVGTVVWSLDEVDRGVVIGTAIELSQT